MAVIDIPVDRITAEARQADVGRALLTIVAAVLYGLGWIVSKTLLALWLAVTWSATAVKVGWVDARRGGGG